MTLVSKSICFYGTNWNSPEFGEGNGNPVQHSCLENPMDRGAWWTVIHGDHKELDMTEACHASVTWHVTWHAQSQKLPTQNIELWKKRQLCNR